VHNSHQWEKEVLVLEFAGIGQAFEYNRYLINIKLEACHAVAL
jgi:hypothetical protein